MLLLWVIGIVKQIVSKVKIIRPVPNIIYFILPTIFKMEPNKKYYLQCQFINLL